MKTKIRNLVVSSLVISSLVLTTSCEKESMGSNSLQYAGIIDVAGDGTTTMIHANAQLAYVETAPLNDVELAQLQKMKAEEQFARDVYTVLNEKWGSTVFSRISNAENNHMSAVIRLLQYYGSADTLTSDAGIFADAGLQSLYNDLTAKGSVSLEEAYKVGALIEEMDIKDLVDGLAATSNANITMVFENLERGSRNHLRSFYNQLTTLGFLYTPVYLTQTEYDQIVTSAMEKGKQYRMNGKGQGNRNGNGKGNENGNGKGGNGQGQQGDGSCNM
jgi:hypothetical protein